MTTTEPHRVALALGANTGAPVNTLRAAVCELSRLLAAPLVSPLYSSTPLHSSTSRAPIPQPDFYNLVMLGSTDLEPEDLLAVLKALELRFGRRRGPREGPRPLDIDLLLYGDRLSSRPELTLPHPRLRQRRFVLAPLVDLAPELALPPDGRTARQALKALDPEHGGMAQRIDWPPEPPTPSTLEA